MADDPFFQPEVTDLWEAATDLIGDASVARVVIERVALGFWNMPWATWEQLAKAGAK